VKLFRHAGALAFATAIATVGSVVPFASSASAALTPSVACSKLVSLPLAQTGGKLKSTVSACTPAALAAGGSTLTAVKQGQTQLTSTITWKNGKGTTVVAVKFAAAKTLGKCKAPYDARIQLTGTVKRSTGAASKILKNGEPLTESTCSVTKAGPLQGKSILEPGTKYKL
jgi:hypothetical protein